jgi:hypothetical protein
MILHSFLFTLIHRTESGNDRTKLSRIESKRQRREMMSEAAQSNIVFGRHYPISRLQHFKINRP